MREGHFVVLGLAGARSVWFREVGRWSTAAAIPVDFVRCVSAEEVRARLGSGRTFSALLVDASSHGLDRDLIDTAVDTGAAVVVVDDGRTRKQWGDLGATAVVPADFHRGELMDVLERHGQPLEPSVQPTPPADGPAVPCADWSGRLVAVTGGSGSGSSTVAMGLAQGLGTDPRYSGLTLLADMALHADLAMLHDARDVVPGLQEVVDAHRTGAPSVGELRSMVFDAPERGYHLLLGLRRHRDWTVLRPRAVSASVDALLRSYRVVVADVDADLEGEDETGSSDVEDRNLLARSVARRAHLVLAVGTPSVKGLHDLLRVIDDLVRFGVDGQRILPVLNRSTRPGRARAEVSRAFGELLAPISAELPAPLHLPERRRLDDAIRDTTPLPVGFTATLASSVSAVLDVIEAPGDAGDEPIPIRPGSLGHFTDLTDDLAAAQPDDDGWGDLSDGAA